MDRKRITDGDIYSNLMMTLKSILVNIDGSIFPVSILVAKFQFQKVISGHL